MQRGIEAEPRTILLIKVFTFFFIVWLSHFLTAQYYIKNPQIKVVSHKSKHVYAKTFNDAVRAQPRGTPRHDIIDAIDGMTYVGVQCRGDRIYTVLNARTAYLYAKDNHGNLANINCHGQFGRVFDVEN